MSRAKQVLEVLTATIEADPGKFAIAELKKVFGASFTYLGGFGGDDPIGELKKFPAKAKVLQLQKLLGAEKPQYTKASKTAPESWSMRLKNPDGKEVYLSFSKEEDATVTDVFLSFD